MCTGGVYVEIHALWRKVRHCFHTVSQQTRSYQYHYIAQMKVHVWLLLAVVPRGHLCWRTIIGNEILAYNTKRNRCDLFQTMFALSGWLACCHTDWFCTRRACVSTLTPPVHITIYSDRFIWYEKAFLICPMESVSNWKSVICIFVQVIIASYEGQRHVTNGWEIGGSLALLLGKVLPRLIRLLEKEQRKTRFQN